MLFSERDNQLELPQWGRQCEGGRLGCRGQGLKATVSAEVGKWFVPKRIILLLFLLDSIPFGCTGQHGRHNFDYLDASIVDVYKDTHAALFLVNPRSASSLSYVRYVLRCITVASSSLTLCIGREHAKQVPLSVCILIIYNFRYAVGTIADCRFFA